MTEATTAISASEAAQYAKEALKRLTGLDPESVSEIRFRDDHWRIVVEVVEMRRIPPTTDVLASYALRLDADGQLLEYHRVRRYYRNQTMEME